MTGYQHSPNDSRLAAISADCNNFELVVASVDGRGPLQFLWPDLVIIKECEKVIEMASDLHFFFFFFFFFFLLFSIFHNYGLNVSLVNDKW